jgi:YidC/Oxa1 family membrane protein insertase
MEGKMQILGTFFGMIMEFCYELVPNYGLTIIIFTLLTKLILLPVSVMVQKNSIKMVRMYPEMNRIKARCYGNKDMISEEEYQLYKRENYHPMLDLIPVILQLIILMGVVEGIRRLDVPDKTFLGMDLSVIPAQTFGISVLIPILAALSAWLMCWTQNKSNVLQSEQGKLNKTITLLVSVGLSLYLGFFVEAGIGCYWMVSNLMSIAVMYLLNFVINPKKYIDYEALEESRRQLQKLEQYTASKADDETSKEYQKREKQDYKRFLKFENKQLVFYSEKNGFYKYFKDVIELILKKTDIVIHYITSDPEDEVFRLQSENFQVYYIGENKLIVLMMKMDSDMVVMTMPDLQKYHIKRSMVREDTEYIYMDHGIGSLNLMLRKHALDYFDTIFASNDLVYREIRGQEKVYGLKEKTIVRYGYSLIDNMVAAYEKQEGKENDPKVILIGPSWQEDNIMDSCIETILDKLLGHGYHVILRPHPQYVRHFGDKLKAMEAQYAAHEDFTLQTDFSSNDTVFNADILITDWSGIAYEYSFTTLKPTLFIDTPMKVMNPDYKEIDVEPFDIVIRNQIGISLKPDALDDIEETVQKLLYHPTYSKESMQAIREQYLYNVGKSAEVGADYIIKRLIEYSRG